MTESLTRYPDNTDDMCNGYFPGLQTWTASWVSFEVAEGEPIELEVTKLDGGAIVKAVVHPAARGDAAVAGGKATVTLTGPRQLTVDINGAMDDTNTGLSNFVAVDPVHTFTVFANPIISDRPSPDDPDVRVVLPGEPLPTQFPESTLLFAPGVHELKPIPACCSTPFDPSAPDIGCRCTTNNASAPGHVESYHLLSNKRYHIPTDAWLDGHIKNDGWGIGFVRIDGYGVISGRRFQRRRCHPYNESPQQFKLRGMYGCNITGVTFVDGSNHHVTLIGWTTLDEAHPPNNMNHVKVLGWRANGDGFHVFQYWNRVTDMWLRTQDDSQYLAGGARAVHMERIVTWNDANGVPFIFTAASNHGTGTLVDSDVLYHRKANPNWCGGIFDLRNSNSTIHDVTIRNVRITDPFPTCPFLDMTGSITNVHFINITMANHSSYRQLDDFSCTSSLTNPGRRFDLPGTSCELPYGIPNRLIAGVIPTEHVGGNHLTTGTEYVYDGVSLDGLSFDNVAVAGIPFADLLTSDGAVITQGSINGLTIDGHMVTFPSPPPPSPAPPASPPALCRGWCAGHSASWSTKCFGWGAATCGACPECHGLTPPGLSSTATLSTATLSTNALSTEPPSAAAFSTGSFSDGTFDVPP